MLGIAVLAHVLVIPSWQALGAAIVTGTLGLVSGLAAVVLLPAPQRSHLIRVAKALVGGLLGFLTAGLVGADVSLLDAVAGVVVALGMMWLTGVVRVEDVRRLYTNLMSPQRKQGIPVAFSGGHSPPTAAPSHSGRECRNPGPGMATTVGF